MKWPEASLRSVSATGPQYGANSAAVSPLGGRPRFVRITDIDNDGALKPDCRMESDLEDFDSYRLAEGDLLFARTGSVGRTYLYRQSDGDCIFAGYLIRFRLNRKLIEPRFLFYFSKSPAYRMWVATKQRVAIQANINGAEYASLRFPLPPLKEQRRIVELLEQADALRRKRTEADALANRILPALFHKMFGDPNRHYKPVPFSSLVREFRYGTSNRSEGEGKPALRIPNVVGEDLHLSDLKLVPVTDEEFSRLQLFEGDMLFVRTNGNPNYVGRCAVFENYAVRKSGFSADEFVFASYLIRARLKPTRANPHFIKQYLQSPGGRTALRERSRTSAGQFNINTDGLGSLPIPLPSLSEQERFAFFVLSMRKLRMQQQSSRENIDHIFVTMLHRAFTGELTASWREAHVKELLAEMEHQARTLETPLEG